MKNDMKKLVILSIAAAVAMLMGSCGGKTQEVPFDNGDSADIANADPTIYGISGEETTMNSLQLITDTGDTLFFDLSSASDKGQVLGGLQVGDRMAVVPNPTNGEALKVINQATLLGDWVMPNPLDGIDEVGIRFTEGGIAESIDQPGLSYRTWRLVNGQLEIVQVEEDAAGTEETFLYDIVKLDADSLVYKDNEDVFEYTRQRAKKGYGSDVKLEDASVEDFEI